MKRKNIKKRVTEYFFANPTARLRVRQIERALKAPLPSVIRYTKELENEGILKKTKMGNVVFYSADRASEIFRLKKKLFNIEQLHASGLITYLKEELHNPTIIVFGSYSRGEDTEESDIDLYVETASKKQIKAGKYGKIIGRSLQFFVHKNIREIKNKELANNIVNGIVINGFVEVFG